MTRSSLKSASAQKVGSKRSLLEAGEIPVEELAELSVREGWRPRPVYQAHRWFARRFGTAFRALLVASQLPPGADFWEGYYEGVDLSGRTVLDPFVGGGTSVVEASRMGANTIGIDIDGVACAITQFELATGEAAGLATALDQLKAAIGDTLAPLYRTRLPNGDERTVVHFFWVQVVSCSECRTEIEAHPHYQLAYEAEGKRQWVFCPECHAIARRAKSARTFACGECSVRTRIEAGPVQNGVLCCPHCDTEERLIDVASRTGEQPRWSLFALEYLDGDRSRLPMSERHFAAASDDDRERYEQAERKLAELQPEFIPDDTIPDADRSDDRLIRYGYRQYSDLFNGRQLLHLGNLGAAIENLDDPERRALAIAFSDHLATNCMMTSYAFGWRRLCPIFAVRAYRHVPRPVELNPWLDGIGRGTFPNAVRQVMRAVEFSRKPRELCRTGGFRPSPANRPLDQDGRVFKQDSQRLTKVPDEAIDLVLTDPPYFDNIAYSELSDFFRPWLARFGLCQSAEDHSGDGLAVHGRSKQAAIDYAKCLKKCFQEMRRVLVRNGRIIFTYQHSTAIAWHALASAIVAAGLQTRQVFPLLGEGASGTHARLNRSTWDAVFVLGRSRIAVRKELSLAVQVAANAELHANNWIERLSHEEVVAPFRQLDAVNFRRACLVAAQSGLFGSPGRGCDLAQLLREPEQQITSRD